MKRFAFCLSMASLFACGSEAGVPVAEAPASEATSPAPGAPEVPSVGSPAPGPSEPAKLGAPYPVVLMHGMGGFGKLEVGPIGVTYFSGVVDDLAKSGEAVYVTLVPPYDSSEERAKVLSTQIDEILKRTGKAKVNLVGHSQGGLDARVITSPQGLGYGDRVASVTTIATPHRGSRVADTVLRLIQDLPPSVVDQVTGDLLDLIQKTAYELQTDAHLRAQLVELSAKHMTTVFNPKYQDAPGVLYMSYAGRTNLRTGAFACDGAKYANDPFDVDAAQVLLAGTAIFLEEGALKVNDGLVTVESARWGVFQECVAADHLKEVGQLGPAAASFDHLKLFRNVVARIRAAGY